MIIKHGFNVCGASPEKIDVLERVSGVANLEFRAGELVFQVQLATIPVVAIANVNDRPSQIGQFKQ